MISIYQVEFTPVAEARALINEPDAFSRNMLQTKSAQNPTAPAPPQTKTTEQTPGPFIKTLGETTPQGYTAVTQPNKGQAAVPNDMATFSRNPAELASGMTPPQTNDPTLKMTPRYWVANETDRLFQEPQPASAIFPTDIHEINVVQPAEDETDARRSSGNDYIPYEETKEEEKKREQEELEQSNLILDEAASWKGHETTMHLSPESLSKASEAAIASFLPFAGLYRFSNS